MPAHAHAQPLPALAAPLGPVPNPLIKPLRPALDGYWLIDTSTDYAALPTQPGCTLVVPDLGPITSTSPLYSDLNTRIPATLPSASPFCLQDRPLHDPLLLWDLPCAKLRPSGRHHLPRLSGNPPLAVGQRQSDPRDEGLEEG